MARRKRPEDESQRGKGEVISRGIETELTQEKVWKFLAIAQEVKQLTKTEHSTFNIFLEGEEAITIDYMSDIHLGAGSMNIESVKNRVQDIINTPGKYVIFGGDVIDGIKAAYLDTIVAGLVMPNVNTQIAAFKAAIFYPLLNAGKVLGAITGFGGHEEWIREMTGLSPSTALYDDAIPYLVNGGKALVYKYEETAIADDPDLILSMAHNDGGSNRPNRPFHGQSRDAETDHNIDAYLSGHNHGVCAVAKIMRADGSMVVYVKEGTDKSDNDESKDPLITKTRPYGRVVIGGTSITIYHIPSKGKKDKKSKRLHITPAIHNYDPKLIERDGRGTTDESLRLLSRAISLKVDNEIIEKHREQAIGIDLKPIMEHSDGANYPQDDTFHWWKLYLRMMPKNRKKIAPLRIIPFAGARAGSKKIDREGIKGLVNEVANDPFTRAVFLREMFDRTLVKRGDRKKVFESLMRLLAPIMNEEDTIAWLFSSSMKHDSWARGKNFKADGLLPGQEINDRYGIPLIDNYSSIILDLMNGPKFSMLMLDDTRYYSTKNIFHGPYNMMQSHSGHDIAIGGKGTESGYESYRDNTDQSIKHLLVPGWLNHEHNIGRKGIRGAAPTNHAGIVLNLLTGETQIGITEDELQNIYDATTLWMALAQSKKGLNYHLKDFGVK